jgi:hypothetical protein
MARRRRTTKRSDERPGILGSHWRADGAPKTSFSTQGEALSVADERRQESGATLNVYRCDYCAGWHMGSSARRER